MINWLDNSDASYVLVAYGLAAACLVLLLVVSVRAAHQSRQAWQKVQAQRSTKDPD